MKAEILNSCLVFIFLPQPQMYSMYYKNKGIGLPVPILLNTIQSSKCTSDINDYRWLHPYHWCCFLFQNKEAGKALSSADWVFSPQELASKFTERTKAIVLNTPNNPLGKVLIPPCPCPSSVTAFSAGFILLLLLTQVYKLEELKVIADLCVKHDVVCISDEVYEWLTYDGATHVKIGEKQPATSRSGAVTPAQTRGEAIT